MMIDHVTYQVAEADLHGDEMTDFFIQWLGMIEVDPSGDVLEKGWNVRWFGTYPRSVVIHLVAADEAAEPLLGHFCLNVGTRRFKMLRSAGQSGLHFVEHDGGAEVGSPLCRLWMRGPSGLRVEVRP